MRYGFLCIQPFGWLTTNSLSVSSVFYGCCCFAWYSLLVFLSVVVAVLLFSALHTHTLIHTPICTASTVSCSFSPSFTQFFPIRVNAFFAVVTTATATATLTSTTATGERDERLRTALGSFSAVAVRNPTCVSWAVCAYLCMVCCGSLPFLGFFFGSSCYQSC